MKRVLTFESARQDQKRFELLYQAILIGGASAQPGSRGGIEVLRREARLLDALDGISIADPDETKGLAGEPGRLVQAEAELVLEQPDFELLKKRVEETPWLPKAARDVVDVIDWLSAAPEQKPVTAEPTDR